MIIVTGGAGFIGSNLIRKLNATGQDDILMVEDFEDDRVRDKLKSVPYSFEQFLSRFEWWAVAQLDDEGIDVIQRNVL